MIDHDIFIRDYVKPFGNVHYEYTKDVGFIVWRRGTGGNVELLHIRAEEYRKGYGRWLFHRMLKCLLAEPPYYSVFGFTLVTNHRARAFYESLGFHCREVEGIYRDGRTVLFWRGYNSLLQRNGYWRKLACPAHPVFSLECDACNGKNAEWIPNSTEPETT